MLDLLIFIFLTGSAYLLGSINSAILTSKIFRLPDPRQAGSHNPGATNVLRLSGKKYAVFVLLFDILKGFLPVWIGHHYPIQPFTLGCIAFAAVLGHVYPIFFKFKGGKGVATALGTLFGLNGYLGLLAITVWLTIAVLTRYSSLSSITTLIIAPFLALLFADNFNIIGCLPLFAMSILVVYLHKENIRRLLAGTESKIILNKK